VDAPVASTPEEMAKLLKEANIDILVNYLPVGSEKATYFWADTCLLAKVAMMNCIPVFVASNEVYAKKFEDAGVPLIGDDIKSQFGASIVSQVLEELAIDRGHTVVYHVQQNTGGNTDFLNMTNQDRLASKKISKENVIRSQHAVRCEETPFVHAGPSDYVKIYGDTKICHIDLELKGFGGSPVHLDLKLKVQDSPNSAGVVIDAIRYLKLAKDAGKKGPQDVSSFLCKSPPIPKRFTDAKETAYILARNFERS
jgi:myo-inositol-1-phosphate synthase